MKDIMSRLLRFSMGVVLMVATTGCASHSILDPFSEDSNHSFRKVSWGFSQERVELAEAGNRAYERTENTLVYRHKINGVYCLLIYTFKDNKLRTAGYVTQTPVMNADNIIREAVDKHGMPTTVNNTEMVWKNSGTVIFANVYDSVKKVTQTKYQHTSGGLLRDVLQRNLAQRGEEGVIKYFDGVFAYVDRAFYNELYEMEFPLSELSFYEKQLMGVIERGKRTIIPGLGTISQGAIRQ